MISGKNQIGEDLSSDSNVTFQTFDPKLNIENDTIFFEASDSEIQKATKLASDAFKIFKQVSAKKRSKFLIQISEELKLISADNLESIEASDQEPSAEESTATASESQESLISETLSDNEPQAEAAVEEDDQK